MYKVLKNIVIIFSMTLLTIFSIWDILTYSAPIPGGVVESVFIMNGKVGVVNQIQKIAEKSHVVIAKQIIAQSDNPQDGMMGNYVFQKLGKGTLPGIYPEEKNSQIIANSNDNTNYIIIGSGLTAKALANQLNAQGNLTVATETDSRLEPLQDLLRLYMVPLLIIAVTFCTLLLASYISQIKAMGIHRLSGESRFKLTFFGLLGGSKVTFFVFILSLLSGFIYFLLIDKLWTAYMESLALVLMFGTVILLLLNLIVTLSTFYFLQMQSINLAIKGKSPMGMMMIVIIAFQILALFASMNSISKVNEADKQVHLLQTAQKSWKSNQQYAAPTLLGQIALTAQTNKELQIHLKDFLLALLKEPSTVLAQSSELQNATNEEEYHKYMNNYVGSDTGWTNTLYVNYTFLQKQKIKLPTIVKNKIKHLGTGNYAILIPNSQKSNVSTISYYWKSAQESMYPAISQTPIISTYQAQSYFTYSVMKNQMNNYSSVVNPVIIVYSAESFQNENSKTVAPNFLAFLSQGSILVTNKKAVNKIFEKYNLQKYQGSFFNGYQAVTQRLNVEANQRNILLAVNILCLFSSLLLISLLNSIYLYQNRKEFLIQRLAGKSWLDIHMIYLAVVVILVALISFVARFWLHVPNEAFVVPAIYLLLVFSLFAVQVRRERRANVLYLKGL